MKFSIYKKNNNLIFFSKRFSLLGFIPNSLKKETYFDSENLLFGDKLINLKKLKRRRIRKRRLKNISALKK